MTKLSKLPEPPVHLSDDSSVFWYQVVETFDLEPHQLNLLRLACEALDSAEEARQIIAESGATYFDRWDCPRPRPEVAIQRESRHAFGRLMKQLNLDCPPPYGARVFRASATADAE